METQLDRLLAAGVSQEVAGRAIGVSRRTVQRHVQRRRLTAEPETLDQLLGKLQPFDWKQSARFLETQYPERWGDLRGDAGV
jgi:hypothetical protein